MEVVITALGPDIGGEDVARVAREFSLAPRDQPPAEVGVSLDMPLSSTQTMQRVPATKPIPAMIEAPGTLVSGFLANTRAMLVLQPRLEPCD